MHTSRLQNLLLVLLAVLLLGALLPGVGGVTLLERRIQDSGHIVLGFVIFWLLAQRMATQPLLRRSLSAWVITSISLAAVEVVQIPLQRDASLTDWLLGGLGALAALLLYVSRGRRSLQVASGLVLLLALSPLIYTSLGYIERQRQFPVLVNFTSPLAAALIQQRQAQLAPGARLEVQGQSFSRLCLQSGDHWPGLAIVEPVADWRGYSTLQLTLYSTLEKPLELYLRIQDGQHNQQFTDRFNTRIDLQPGYNRLEIALDKVRLAPETRNMDMADISEVILFTRTLRAPVCFFAGQMVLLGQSDQQQSGTQGP